MRALIYEIPVKEITRENITAYGQYFDTKGITPDFSDASFDWWNEIGLADINGRASFGIVNPKFNAEFSERVFEQHNSTPEVLIPIDEDVIVLVGKKDAFIKDAPKPEDFEAFLVPKGSAVCLNAGVWHHAPMVKGVSSRVFVIFKEKTSFNDCLMKDLTPMDLTIKVKV